MSEHTGEAEPRTMTYQDLRRMTECAASYRGHKVWIVIDETGWRIEQSEPATAPGTSVIPYDNGVGKKPAKKNPRVESAKIRAQGMKKAVNLLDLKDKDGNDLGPADAIFWTASAVEKFVVPYYASVYADEAPGKLEKIISVLDNVNEPSGSGAGDQAAGPFALAHMPKSEYVQVEGAFAVLVSSPDGGHVTVPITEYPGPGQKKTA